MDQTLSDILRNNSKKFHPVVPYDRGRDKLVLFDFTKNNQDIAGVVDNTQQFTDYVNAKLKVCQAKYAIGGYNEYRELYRRSRVFDGDKPGDEPRRLHLGVDIWGRPYTPVRSPLDGVVHSFAFNNDFGDYGATLIVSHILEGRSFHILYGHLSLNSIRNLREGGNVRLGDVIGEFGIQMENGQWPPHLHFQLIEDIGEWKGNYPGVCKLSERNEYLENCPDPDLILKMVQFAVHE